MDKLSFLESDNLVDNLGEFNRIKHQLEEFGTIVRNPIHKLLGKLPSSFESFKDNIYICVPFPSFDEALGLLHDKCLSCNSSSKNDAAFLGKIKGSPRQRVMVMQKAIMLRPMKHPRRATNLHQATNKRNAPSVVIQIIRRNDALQRKEHPRLPRMR